MKHFRKRMLTNGLAMALVVSSLVAIPVAAANNIDFKDIKGHWAETQIKSFLEKGHIEGYGDNTFRPDNKITRAEFIKIVNMAFGFNEKGTENFKDVNSGDWFYDEVLKAMKQGYIDGYGDDTFKPNEPISREEACKIVGVVLKANGYGNTTFKDDSEIQDWAKKYVKGLVDMGIIDGFKEDNTFRPKANTSRAETVKTVKGAIEYEAPSGGGGSGGTVSREVTIDSNDDFNNLSGSYDKITIKGNTTGEIKNIKAKVLVIEDGHEVTIKDSTIANMTVKDIDNSVEIIASGTTRVENMVLESGAKLSYESGSARVAANPYGKLNIKTSENIIINAMVDEVTVSEDNARLEVAEGTKVDKIIVNNDGATIYGSGNITSAVINANCIIADSIIFEGTNEGSGAIESKHVVSNLDELNKALEGEENEIYLASDISGINKSINVNREVTINGGGHKLSFTGLEGISSNEDDGLIISEKATVENLAVDTGLANKSEWVGTYAIHVYGTEATLNNITATGGNGGILVNGSITTLTGNIDVSNNGFGGIEVSQGDGMTSTSTLNIQEASIINTSEAYSLPTIWTIKGQGTLVGEEKFTKNEDVKKDQTQYYLEEKNSLKTLNVSNLEALESALADETVKIINIADDIKVNDKNINVNREVTINGGGHKLSFTGLEGISSNEDDGLIISKNATVENLTVDAGLANKSEWVGTYAIHVYGTEATLNNVTATGGNGGILVNGSTVTLTGDIDVSNNGFGGIEVSRGKNLQNNGKLIATNGSIVNRTESSTQPTAWIDGDGSIDGLENYTKAKVGEKTHYYKDANNKPAEGNVEVSND